MRERFHLPIAMCRVHFDLLGGQRRLGLIVAGYFAAVSIGLYMFRRALINLTIEDFAAGFVQFLVIAQGLILVAGGSTSIYRSMLRDFDTRMLESHRLSPMSNVSVVLGYALGATQQVLLLAVLNLIVGILFSVVAKKPLGAWLGGNLMLFVGATVFWSFTIFIGLRKPKPLNPTVFLVLAGMFGMPAMSIPAVGSFLGAYAVLFGVWIGREDFKIPTAVAAAVAAVSVVVAVFWFHVSAAKYRRPDLPALNGFRGLLFLLLWLVLGALGIRGYVAAASTIMNTSRASELNTAQVIATLIGALLLAWVPISGAVECRLIAGRGGSLRDFGDRLTDRIVALLAALLTIAIPAFLAGPAWYEVTHELTIGRELKPLNGWIVPAMGFGWFPVGAAIFLSALTVRGVFRFCYARPVPQRIRAVVMLAILLIVPVAIDLARMGLVMEREIEGFADLSALAAFSPAGVILCLLVTSSTVKLVPGLLFQAGLAALLTLIGNRKVRQRLTTPDDS